jgi:SDR family mycofactocin-dependent oxidoreductase
MSDLTGKVVLVTGAARGQGRSHAVHLAGLGADIIGIDICASIDSVHYALATPSDLQKTVTLVEATGRRMLAYEADVRDADAVAKSITDGVAQFGRLDVVVANAGISALDDQDDNPRQTFRDVIDVNLVGVWNTMAAALQPMLDGGRGGSFVLISSTGGLKGNIPGNAGGDAYVAAKHALVGLARNWANAYAKNNIRVNTSHPTGVATPMVENEALGRFHAQLDMGDAALTNLLPVELLQPVDISYAVAWLASEEARYITGVALPVDAGYSIKA